MRQLTLVLTLFIAFFGKVFSQTPADESTLLSNTRQLIYEGKRSGEGYFSPDGKKIVFQSERDEENPFYQIYTLDLESGETQRVSTGKGKTTCAYFNHAADRIMFASSHLDPKAEAKQHDELHFRASGKTKRYAWDYDETMDIFSSKPDGSDLRRLTAAQGYDAEGAYSPDGKKIIFSSMRDAYPLEKLSPELKKKAEMDLSYFGEVYIMNADGTEQTRLTDWPGYDGGTFFSPDGKRVIWRHFDENGEIADVYTMKIDGTDRVRVTNFKCMAWAPFYHPSQKYIIFTANKLGFSNFELFIVDVEGKKEPVRVTFTDGFDGLPVFSPDGKKLLWTTNRTADKKSQLFFADWNHEKALELLGMAPLQKEIKIEKIQGGGGMDRRLPIAPEISKVELKAKVFRLADDEMLGRLTGTDGTKLAASFISEEMDLLGLKFFAPNYRHNFPFVAGIDVIKDKNKMSAFSGKFEQNGQTSYRNEANYEVKYDWQPLVFSGNGHAYGEPVFVGYGFSPRAGSAHEHDDYANVDVKDKIVVILRGVPQNVTPDRKRALTQYADLRYKALIAKQKGAKAVVFVDARKDKLIPLENDNSLAGSEIIAVSVLNAHFKSWLTESGKNWAEIEKAVNSEADKQAFTLVSPISLNVQLKKIEKQDDNIVGYIPASNGSAEYIVIGAHYDHLGHGEVASRADEAHAKEVHNGADDNASGVATVLELAEYFADLKQRSPEKITKNIVFALWSGEELGLVGSSYFCEKPPFDLKKVTAYVNFDMVGRLENNKLIVGGIGSSKNWTSLLEKKNIAAGFNLDLQSDPYLPTDATSFYLKEVPILGVFTGIHEAYHRPDDDPQTLNYEGMERIAVFSKNIVEELLKPDVKPVYEKVKANENANRKRSSSIYLGTIPAYESDAQGVKLSGVSGSGPAEAAGLKAGDIIIGMDGQKITNIYEYMYIMDGLSVGKTVDITVLREGKEVKLSITPGERK